jgi:hypothetical protein
LNKQVGLELGITEITVKSHRGRVMRKMRARTFVELMAMAAWLPQRVGASSPADSFRVTRPAPANTLMQLQSFAGLRPLEAVGGM